MKASPNPYQVYVELNLIWTWYSLGIGQESQHGRLGPAAAFLNLTGFGNLSGFQLQWVTC